MAKKEVDTKDAQRSDLYTNRTGDHLLHMLSIVSKTDIDVIRKSKPGKDELIEALDAYPTNSLAMADKIVSKGDGEPSDDTTVQQVIAEITSLFNAQVEQRVTPLDKRLATLQTELPKIVNKATDTLGVEFRAAIAELTLKLASEIGGLESAVISKRDLPGMLAKHSIDQTTLQSAVAEKVDEKFATFVKQLEAIEIKTDGKLSATDKKKVAVQQGMQVVANRARVVKVDTAEAVFGVKLVGLDGVPMKVELWNDPEAETINPDYVFDPEHLRAALLAMSKKPCRNAFLFGETGTGKTEFVRQLSARLGRRLFRINFENGADSYNFIGGERAKDATTVYQYGTFSKGLRHPGAIILLDELCFGKPGHLAALHATLEEAGKLTITETGERLERDEGVMIFAADNTNGTGDRSGRYDGLYTMNSALRRRFSYWMQFQYMHPDAEADLINRRAGVGITAARQTVKLITAMRTAARAGHLSDSPSLPHAIAFCEMVMAGREPRAAFEQTMVLSTSPEYAEKLNEIYIASLKEDEFKKAVLSGK